MNENDERFNRVSLIFSFFKTSFPLIISTSSYPLFTMLVFLVVASSYRDCVSSYVLAQSMLTVIIRGAESLLSGTRIRAANSACHNREEKAQILHSSVTAGFWIATKCIFLALIMKIFMSGFFNAPLFVDTFMILTFGLYGHFLFNSVYYYVHGYQDTKFIPIVSWSANTAGLVIILLSARYLKLSYISTIWCYSLSRFLLGFLAYALIPQKLSFPFIWSSLKEYKNIYSVIKVSASTFIYSLTFSVTYFLFNVYLEKNSPYEIESYQLYMNILNILSTINVPIATSATIFLVKHREDANVVRKYIFNTNLFINYLIALSSFLFIFLTSIVLKKLNFNVFHLDSGFYIIILIYFIDLLQIIYTQTLIYHKDYLLPPAIRGGIFFAGSMAFLYGVGCFSGKTGVLLSSLFGTTLSFIWMVRRFSNAHPVLFGFRVSRKKEVYLGRRT